MWIVRKNGKVLLTARDIQETYDSIVSEGGRPSLYNGKTIIDCKRAVILGDSLCEVRYQDARIYKVYGNLWVCMYKDKQIALGTLDECELALMNTKPDDDISRNEMIFKGQFEDCIYTATWEEFQNN